MNQKYQEDLTDQKYTINMKKKEKIELLDSIVSSANMDIACAEGTIDRLEQAIDFILDFKELETPRDVIYAMRQVIEDYRAGWDIRNGDRNNWRDKWGNYINTFG